MAKIVLEEQPEFVVFPPESILELKIEEVNIETVPGRNGGNSWEKLSFKFKILGIQAIGDGSPMQNYESMITQNIYGSVAFRLTDSPENKLRIWTEAILGIELGVGFELDTDMFPGRQCRGLTSTYTGKNGVRHQIDTLLPKAGGVQAAPATQSAPAAWAAPATPAPAASAPADPWATPGGGSAWGNDEPPF